MRPETVDASGARCGKAVDSGNRVHPSDEQRQPLPERRVGAHEVRGHLEVENHGRLDDYVRRQGRTRPLVRMSAVAKSSARRSGCHMGRMWKAQPNPEPARVLGKPQALSLLPAKPSRALSNTEKYEDCQDNQSR